MTKRDQPRRLVNVYNELLSMAELAAIAGVNAETIRQRLDLGWDIEKIIKTPRQNVQGTVSVGNKFGRLTVTGHAPPGNRGRTRYMCDCSCGHTGIVVREYSLKIGTTKSCGQCNKVRADFVGTRLNEYGSVVVECIVDCNKGRGLRGSLWRCRCACGALFDVPGHYVSTTRRSWCKSSCEYKAKMRESVGRKNGKLNAGRKR